MTEFNAADYGIDWPTTPKAIVEEALREFVGDGEGVDGAVFAAFVDEIRATQRAEVSGDVSTELLLSLVDRDDCWFDHHGGCQAHGYLRLEHGQVCPQAELKEILKERGDE